MMRKQRPLRTLDNLESKCPHTTDSTLNPQQASYEPDRHIKLAVTPCAVCGRLVEGGSRDICPQCAVVDRRPPKHKKRRRSSDDDPSEEPYNCLRQK